MTEKMTGRALGDHPSAISRCTGAGNGGAKVSYIHHAISDVQCQIRTINGADGVIIWCGVFHSPHLAQTGRTGGFERLKCQRTAFYHAVIHGQIKRSVLDVIDAVDGSSGELVGDGYRGALGFCRVVGRIDGVVICDAGVAVT